MRSRVLIVSFVVCLMVSAMVLPAAASAEDATSAGLGPVKLTADVPAVSMGLAFQANAHAMSIAAANAVNAQQQSYVLSLAAITKGVSTLYALDATDGHVTVVSLGGN